MLADRATRKQSEPLVRDTHIKYISYRTYELCGPLRGKFLFLFLFSIFPPPKNLEIFKIFLSNQIILLKTFLKLFELSLYLKSIKSDRKTVSLPFYLTFCRNFNLPHFHCNKADSPNFWFVLLKTGICIVLVVQAKSFKLF